MTEDGGAQRRAVRTDGPTRIALVRAARDSLAEFGLEGTTSRRICQRAGVNLASITYHFGSKDALVAEALTAEVRERLEPALVVLADDRPAPERLAAAIAALVDGYRDERERTRVVLTALLHSSSDPVANAPGRALLDDLRTRLSAVIDDVAIDGDAAQWVSGKPMAELLMSIALGLAVFGEIDPGFDPLPAAGQLVGLLLAVGPTLDDV